MRYYMCGAYYTRLIKLTLEFRFRRNDGLLGIEAKYNTIFTFPKSSIVYTRRSVLRETRFVYLFNVYNVSEHAPCNQCI